MNTRTQPLSPASPRLRPVHGPDRPAPPGAAGLLHHQEVRRLPIGQLKPAERNARTHSPRQLRQIAASIERFGFVNPVLISGDSRVIAGHGRLEAARLLGLAEVPTLRLDHLTAAEQRAYALADNRLAELAGWDRELLALELQELGALELDFDITLTGFETGEIDVLMSEIEVGGSAEAEPPIPAPAAGPPVTRPGDLWQIGPHRLLCADATQAASYERLLGGEPAQLVFTDPPYNVPIQGHVSGLGKVQHREFAMAAGEMSREAFTGFLRTVFDHLVAASTDGAIHFVCMDWRHLPEVLAAGEASYTELKNLCVWAKTNGGMGALYRSQHELVLVFKSGRAPHINNVELGRHGRYRTNVWSYAGVNTFRNDREDELALHPTVKPVALVADALRDCSRRGGIVLDAFAGSGTTLLAAHQTGRRGYGMELDPVYCDVIVRRLAAVGLEARHCPTGQSFHALQDRQTGQEAE